MKQLFIFLGCISFIGCAGPEARRPKEVRSGSFIQESVQRSKALLEKEQQLIQQLIAQDSAHSYQSTASGSWFFYQQKNEDGSELIQTDDMVTLTYDLISFSNDTIYSQAEIGTLVYKVDKQELFPGLRNSIKTLKEGEIATFLFPSSLAYGYHGDNDKIGANVPVKSTINILTIERKKDSIQN